ncbi:MAG: hypothetical protein Q9223_002525 [Gallowayella weberi]
MDDPSTDFLYPLQAPLPKRRRANNGARSPSRYSSPDELAAHSNIEPPTYHRRTSSKNLSRPAAETPRRSYDGSPREDSPDELDHTIHTFYRHSPTRSEISQLTPLQAPASPATSLPPATPLPPTSQEARFLPYKPKMVLKGHSKGVAAVRFSPKGDMIASCSADATIRIWETSTGDHLHTLEGHLAGISTLAWSPDNRVLASGSDDKSIRLWDAVAGKQYPRQLLGHNNYIYSIAFSPKGNMIVSGSYDEAVFLWDVRTARVMRSLPAHSDPVGGVDFIRDGTLIVSCAGDGLIRIWDTATGQCLRTLVHEDNAPVSSVRFAPNGRFVLAWTLDSCVRLWNYHEGRCMKTYQGHQNAKFSLSGAFGVYGDEEGEVPLGEKKAFAVSGSETGEIVWWDVVSKAVLQREMAHEGCVLGVDTWGKEGVALAVSCGLDRTVRIWERVEGEPENEFVKDGENGAAEENGISVDGEQMDAVNGDGG